MVFPDGGKRRAAAERCSEDKQKQFCTQEADNTTAGKGQNPGQDHFLHHAPVDGGKLRAAPTPIMAVVLV